VTADEPAGATDPVSPARFRDVLARFPSGVTIATTRDSAGVPQGLTVSAFCSVSLRPPLVAVCVARSASCHPAFASGERFAVSVLARDQLDLALAFARTGTDKFAHGGLRGGTDGIDVVDGALAVLGCAVHSRHEAGDHTIVVGEVHQVEYGKGEPLVVFDRSFHRLAGVAR